MDERVAVWRFAGIEVDVRRRQVRVNAEEVALEPRPFDLLLLLLQHAGSVVTTDEILETVWAGRVVSEVQVANTIGKIRKALRDEQQKLIATTPKVGYRLVADVQTTPDQKPHYHVDLKPGMQIPGRTNWKLIERIGGGGFGDVWMAIQDKTQYRRVYKFCQENRQLAALKREVTLFRLLRQALGKGAPIVTISDWQFDESPYFIESEYAGPDLRTWFDSRGGIEAVPLAERLELVAQIAEAVAAAHNVGVLHKDLKPQNVLVSAETGRILLCDFGTARLLDTAQHLQLGITVHGFTQTVVQAEESGTILYMAPELLSGGRASASSDVYAVGVMLYQLVVGRWVPIAATGWEGDVPDELLREDILLATHFQPQKRTPSAQVLAERLRTLPARRAEQQRLRENQRRLERAQQLLERSRARRPWMIAAGVALLVGFSISTMLLYQTRRAARVAEQERNTAQQLNIFLADVFKAASPDYGGHFDISLKDAIGAALPKATQRLQDSPLSEASIDLALADAMYTLSEPVEAQKLAARAASLYGEAYGAADVHTLGARVDLAHYRTATDDANQVNTDFTPAVERLQRDRPQTDPLLIKARYVEALLSNKLGDEEKALQQLDALFATFPRDPDPQLVRTLDDARIMYVRSLVGRRKGPEALKFIDQVKPHFVAIYGEQGLPTIQLHEYTALAHSVWGNSMPGEHHFDEAVAEGRMAVDGFTALFGPDGQDTLNSQQMLGDVYLAYDDYEHATPLYEAAYRGLIRHYGQGSEWTLRPLLRIVQCEVDSGHAERVLPRARELVSLANKNLKPTDYLYRHVVLFTSQAFLAAGDVAEGSPLLDQAERLLDKNKTDTSTKSGLAYLVYLKGIRAQEQNHTAEARQLLTAAVQALADSEGPDDIATRDAKTRLQSIEQGGGGHNPRLDAGPISGRHPA